MKTEVAASKKPRTCFSKLWDQHRIAHVDEHTDLLHIDRLLLHELTGSVTFQQLARSGNRPAAPETIFSIVDHLIATEPGRHDEASHTSAGPKLIRLAREASERYGFTFIGGNDLRQGITHVVAPELGIALPGLTVVCSDSHTCTLGGIGALAWGIGSTECSQVASTQTLLQARPKNMLVSIEGWLGAGVAVKDVVLHLMRVLGAKGGDGFAIEYAGAVVRAMSVEERLTLCNMTIEVSSKYGVVAPDDVTIEYFARKGVTGDGEVWDAAVQHWQGLASDPLSEFEHEVLIDASRIEPTVTWGISPEHAVPISGAVPHGGGSEYERARTYIGLHAGKSMSEVALDFAYIGSCTNGRLSDLREAARLLEGRHVARSVTAICVPGSAAVKRAAEAEGIDRIFKAAGFEWHEPGCGFCAYLGNDRLRNARVISTTNRNFENRQGVGTKTHLASPATVAASAVMGRITDPRSLVQ